MSYFIFLNFKVFPGEKSLSELKDVKHRNKIIQDLILEKARNDVYILGDGQSSHQLVDWCDVKKNIVKVNPAVIRFFKSCFDEGCYPNIVISYADHRVEDSYSIHSKEKVSKADFNDDFVFKENTKYSIF
jgi:hypothetical protein